MSATSTPSSILAQEQLLPFLLNPRSYPHRPKQVRLIQTHASYIFIAPPLVFKLKKPVNLGFLNFSTLEKRRHFCQREVELNRRLAPNVYLGVVPIGMRQGRFLFGEGDHVVEYAVKMRLLSARHFLDKLIERGEAGTRELNRIVRMLSRFYQAQKPDREIEAWGRRDRLRISTEENFRQTRQFIGLTLSRPAFEAIQFYTDRFYARHGRLFASRIRDKRIRDCHGDLHLEHIHLTPRALNIYDCIEFNDRLRYVDVASDAAFLAMDLDFEGRPNLARHFASKMASVLRDDGMPLLMDFYKCYRAYVRGKVESLHSLAHAPEAERQASAESARRYFRLALRYAIAGSEPIVLVVMGRIASGKSTVARALSAELGWEVYSSDVLRKQAAGFPLYERSAAAARKRLYSSRMTAQTYKRLLDAASAEVRAGRGAILDATFARTEHRKLLARYMEQRGLHWRVLEVRADDSAVRRRLKRRGTRSDEVSDARLEDFHMLNRLYQPPTELPAARRARVQATGPLDRTVARALRELVNRRI